MTRLAHILASVAVGLVIALALVCLSGFIGAYASYRLDADWLGVHSFAGYLHWLGWL
jgi:hypothetical protein